MGILPTEYVKTLKYTIVSRVLDMLHDKHIDWPMMLVMVPDDGNSDRDRDDPFCEAR